MRVEEQPAYILHQRPFRDTSQILEVFSRDHGRLSVMSRGSRGAKSRLKSVLIPFRPLLLSWSGKGEMPNLTGAELAAQSVQFLQGKSLACAMYINELVMYLTYRHDPQTELFSHYHEAIHGLNDITLLEKQLRLFELNLLQSIGVSLDFTIADNGADIDPESKFCYESGEGLRRLNGTLPKGVPMLHGSTLLLLRDKTLDNTQALQESKRLMRYILSELLGDKPLRSRELFR